MKKLFFFLMVILSFAISVIAQPPVSPQPTVTVLSGFDTTVSSYKDTLKNYTYSNVYLIVTSVNLNRGTSVMYYPGSMQSANFDTWKAMVTYNFYSSKSDYLSGKQSITQTSTQIELTTSYPTQDAILTKLIQLLPK